MTDKKKSFSLSVIPPYSEFESSANPAIGPIGSASLASSRRCPPGPIRQAWVKHGQPVRVFEVLV